MDCCKCKQREPNFTFIREVCSAPEMLVVLANSLQLAEVKRFCTNLARFSVLEVDVTFNVGDLVFKVRNSRYNAWSNPFTPMPTICILLHTSIYHDLLRPKTSRSAHVWN